MTAPVVASLTRHELLWVVEQCGGGAWPYPLRAVAWEAETEEGTARHRRTVEDTLRARGLLEPAPAAVLLAVGELVRDWTVAVDLVHRSPTAPRAGVGLAVGAGGPGALLVSDAHADAPVRVALVAAERLPEAVVGTVAAVAPGRGPEVGAPVDDPTGAAPATRRAEESRRAVAALVDTATGWGQVGVATRTGPHAGPVRPTGPSTWLDGPHGRWRVRHDRSRGVTRALLAPVDAAGLAAAVRAAAEDAAAAGPSGRSTA